MRCFPRHTSAMAWLAILAPTGVGPPHNHADAGQPQPVSSSPADTEVVPVIHTPLRAIPADARAVLLGRGPDPESANAGSAGATVGLLAFLADQVAQMGLLSGADACTRAWVDSLASIPLLFRYPHAIALLDISANARKDGGHQLAALNAALILQTKGDNQPLQLRIQHLLNSYTNSEETVLSSKNVARHELFTLTDRRLPSWAEISWGAIGDLYVVTLGEGTFARVKAALDNPPTSLAGDAWFAGSVTRVGAADATAVLYVRLDDLSQPGDRLLTRKIQNVQSSLGLGGGERMLWSFRRSGRALLIDGVVRRNGGDERLQIASLADQTSPAYAVIPEAATGYAIVEAHPSAVVGAVSKAYLASQSPRSREESRRFWRELQTTAGVDIENDLLVHLSSPIVVHDFPPHLLKLPLALTILVPISGDFSTLRSNLDNILEATAKTIPPESMVQLRRDPDGVWHSQFGIDGPGLVVTERWLVVSYSPEAVRRIAKLVAPAREATTTSDAPADSPPASRHAPAQTP